MIPTKCFLLVCLFLNVESARILAIVSIPSFSHQNAFRQIWKELSTRGHEVVLFTTDPMNNSSLTNLREINLHGAYPLFNIAKKLSEGRFILNPLKLVHDAADVLEQVTKFELEHPEVQNILKNESEHFDVVMSESAITAMFGFSYRFKCPLIAMTSSDSPFHMHHLMGNPTHSAMYPELTLPFIPPLNFLQRVVSLIYNCMLSSIIIGNVFTTRMDLIIRTYFGEDSPTSQDFLDNVSILFINTNPLFQTIRPLGPRTIAFGGGVQLTQPKAVPEELNSFLNSANEVIYFSLGTNVKNEVIGDALIETFLNTFKDLRYNVLWKLDASIPNLPKHIKVVSWAPQQDILRHANVKLFITQGGLQSTEEAVFLNVPMVIIPFISDQETNARLSESKGFGLRLDRSSLTKQILTKTIEEVIKNPKYKESTEKYAQLALDQPMTGVEKVVWWTEYVIRHKGTSHLKNNTIPTYQFYHLDVLAFLSMFIFILLLIMYKLLGLTYRFIKYFISKVVKVKHE